MKRLDPVPAVIGRRTPAPNSFQDITKGANKEVQGFAEASLEGKRTHYRVKLANPASVMKVLPKVSFEAPRIEKLEGGAELRSRVSDFKNKIRNRASK